MAKIVRTTKEGREELPLGSFSLTIGRLPDNHIVIDNSYTAPRHAVVGFADGRYFIEDLKSSHGTRVNGSAVTRTPLRHGDAILIGLQRLEFVDAVPALATKPPAAVPPAPIAPAATPPAAATPPPVAASAEPETTVAPAAPALPEPASSEAGNLLEQLVGSIRSHRDREQQEREAGQARLRAEWDKTVAYAEQLKAKVDGDPRVHYFTISRRNDDVIVRAQRNADLPIQFIQLSMQHPDEKGHALSGIWLRRGGMPDRCFPTAKDAVAELVRELAFLIA